MLQYNFPLPIYNLKASWFSGIAYGQALQVLIKTHEITKDLKYLGAAKILLNAFFIDLKDGGITYKDSSNDWYYEEYASNDKNIKISRVLNGMLYAVLGIYDYYKYTNDNDAKLLFDKVVQILKKRYPNTTIMAIPIYYDLLGNPALKYHQIHVDLLKKLYNITGEPILIQYSDLWKNYCSSDVNVKEMKMTASETDLCSDRIDNEGDGLIEDRDLECSTRNFNINTDKSVDFSKVMDNNAKGLAPSFSPPTIAQGTEDLSALQKIIKLKKQWLNQLP